MNNLNRSQALVLSVFPGMGKTYLSTHYQNIITMLDSDSSLFSWIISDDGTKTRNPEFPSNYIDHIRDNLDKVDVIFVSSHEQVRQALTYAGVHYVSVRPAEDSKSIYLMRYKVRGDDESFISMMNNNWSDFIKSMTNDEGSDLSVVLKGSSYLTLSRVLQISETLPDYHNPYNLKSSLITGLGSIYSTIDESMINNGMLSQSTLENLVHDVNNKSCYMEHQISISHNS